MRTRNARSRGAMTSMPLSVGCGAALFDQGKKRAHALRLSPHRPARTFLRIPGVQVQVQPRRTLRYESLEKQRADYRARKCRCRGIAEIRDFAGEIFLIGAPQRHRPEWIMLFLTMTQELGAKRLVVAVKSRQVWSERNAGCACQCRQVDQEVRRLGVGFRDGVGKHEPP